MLGCFRVPVLSTGSFLPLLILCLTLLCHFCHVTTTSQKYTVKKTIKLDAASGSTANFKDHEKFQDMFELTEENFEEMVLDAEDPWVVVFTDGMLKREWKTLAVSLRGIVWFGILQRLQQEDLLDEIDFNVRKNPPARVYPYGGSKQKAKWTDVQSAKEAGEIAVDSLPEIATEVHPEIIHDFLYESYLRMPPSFPAVFIIENEMPAAFKSIALHYNRYFSFGVVRNPGPSDLATLKYDLSIPGFLVLVSEDYGSDDRVMEAWKESDYNFQSFGYTPERQGELNYPNLVKFLYSINIQYRHTLPGTNMADDEDVLTMEDCMEVEGQRFNVRYMDELRSIRGSETEKLMKDDKLDVKSQWKMEL